MNDELEFTRAEFDRLQLIAAAAERVIAEIPASKKNVAANTRFTAAVAQLQLVIQQNRPA